MLLDQTPYLKGSYKDKAETIPCALPFKLIHERKAGSCALLIHGYGGYPGELERPAVDLYENGFDVFVPRLPGMGTSGEDFLSSTKEDWLNLPLNIAKDLRKRYEKLVMVGHSMGALVATLVCKEVKAEKLILAAPALKLPKETEAISPSKERDIPIPWKSDARFHLHYDGAPKYDELLGKEYWSHVFPWKLRDLISLANEAKDVLLKLDVDTLVIKCGRDETTDNSGCDVINGKGKGNNRLAYIPNATHYLFYDIEGSAEEEAVRETLSFSLGN